MERTAVLALAVGLASGCGSSESDSRRCVPGQSVGCIGPEGCTGYQVCEDDGTGFGACVCEGGGTSTGGGATLASGGSPAGGSAASRGGAVGSPTDATGGSWATAGAGGSPATGGAAIDCAPADMSAWTAPAYVPARAALDVCTEALIRQYSTDCLNGGNCAPFEAGEEYEACGDCLRPTPSEEAEYGPLVLSGILRETNFAGCIELMGESECAAHQQAKSRCEYDACHDNCPVTSAASLEAYRQCELEARTGVCDAYREAAVCIVDPAHVEACGGDDFEESFVAVAMAFCGSLGQAASIQR